MLHLGIWSDNLRIWKPHAASLWALLCLAKIKSISIIVNWRQCFRVWKARLTKIIQVHPLQRISKEVLWRRLSYAEGSRTCMPSRAERILWTGPLLRNRLLPASCITRAPQELIIASLPKESRVLHHNIIFKSRFSCNYHSKDLPWGGHKRLWAGDISTLAFWVKKAISFWQCLEKIGLLDSTWLPIEAYHSLINVTSSNARNWVQCTSRLRAVLLTWLFSAAQYGHRLCFQQKERPLQHWHNHWYGAQFGRSLGYASSLSSGSGAFDTQWRSNQGLHIWSPKSRYIAGLPIYLQSCQYIARRLLSLIICNVLSSCGKYAQVQNQPNALKSPFKLQACWASSKLICVGINRNKGPGILHRLR